MKNKIISLICLILFLGLNPSFAGERSGLSFKATFALLQKAVQQGDTKTLHQYVELDGIIKAKIEKYAHKAQGRKSFLMRSIGKITEVGEPALGKVLVGIIDSEFAKTSPVLRQKYLNQLKINRIGEKGDYAFAAGTFLGSPAAIAALKKGAKWVIVGVESPIIDREFKNLLAKLRIK